WPSLRRCGRRLIVVGHTHDPLPLSWWLFEISASLEILEQPYLRRRPAEHRAGAVARCWMIDGGEMREPAEMRGGVCGRLADDRQVEAASDRGGDLAE